MPSAVLGTILLVSITTATAAAAFPYAASAIHDLLPPPAVDARVYGSTFDTDNDGYTEVLRFALARADADSYPPSIVRVNVLNPDGTTTTYASQDDWTPGGALYIPCLQRGPQTFTVTIGRTVALSGTLPCDAGHAPGTTTLAEIHEASGGQPACQGPGPINVGPVKKGSVCLTG